MKKCKNPWCNKEFAPIDGRQKYCSKECAAFMRKRQKHGKISDVVVYVKCEQCGKDHNGFYGSGRFCSAQCAKEFIASKNKGAKNPKVKAHLDKLRLEGKLKYNKAKYGTWKCPVCNKIFETRAMLKTHIQQEHNVKIQFTVVDGKFICPYCGKGFEFSKSLGGHVSNCKMHPNKESHDIAHKQAGNTLKRRIAAGEVIPAQTGKSVSIEVRQKISDSRIKTLDTNLKCGRRLDVKWYKVRNLNGVEYTVRGYWEENVALELNRRGILWERNKAVKYRKDIIRNYVPDFYLPQFDNTFLEVKGYFPQEDYEKMKLALEYNLTMKLFLVGEDKYQDFIDGKVDLQNCSFA